MKKPRPFLVGMLTGSMALSPVSWALASAPADSAGDAIIVQSGGLEAMLVDRKDAGLKRALMMLDDRLLELPDEVDEPNMPAGMIKMIWDNLISPMSLRFGMNENPEPGAAPFHAQLIVNTMEPGTARQTASMLANMLENEGAEWGQGPMGGVRMTEAPFGKMMLGAAALNGKESLVIGVNTLDVNAPAMDVSNLLPRGIAPVMAVHADMKQLTPLMEMAMQDPDAAIFRDMMISSGMMGEDAVTFDMAMGHGEDRMYGGLVMHNYAKAGATWGAIPGKSLPESVFRAIPVDATYANAGMYDWSKLPDMLREFAAQAGEEQDPFEIMEEELGFNPDSDLIAHLGDTFVMYQSDTSGGGGLMSMVAMTSLKNPDAFARTHAQIVEKINRLAREEAQGYVRIHAWNEGGLNAFTLTTPGLPLPLEISWAISGDRVIAGATPAALMTAAQQLNNPKSSILNNKKVVEMAGQMDNLMAFEFVDTPRHVRQGYGVAQAVGSMIANAVRSPHHPDDPARNIGPIMLPFNEFVEGVQPMVAVGRWQGDDLAYTWQGDRSMMVNIAGAGGAMGGMVGIVMIGALGAGVLMPALSKARENAIQVKSMSQTRGLVMGLIVYMQDADGALPTSMKELIDNDIITHDMLSSPYGPAWDGEGDYAYRTDMSEQESKAANFSASTILLIDRAMLLNEGVTAVGFFDGHVELLDSDELMHYLQMDSNQGAIDSLGIPDWMRP